MRRTKPTSVYLPAEIRGRVEAEAAELDRDISSQIVHILKSAFRRRDKLRSRRPDINGVTHAQGQAAVL